MPSTSDSARPASATAARAHSVASAVTDRPEARENSVQPTPAIAARPTYAGRARPVMARNSWLEAGRAATKLPGPRHIVVLAQDQALSVKAAARLQVGDRVPAPVGIGGQVTDRVEDAHTLLAGEGRRRLHVLAHVGRRIRILQVADSRRGQHSAAGDVMQVPDHAVVVRGPVVLRGVGIELVGEVIAL